MEVSMRPIRVWALLLLAALSVFANSSIAGAAVVTGTEIGNGARK
jgi:hypothetical protein